MPDGTHAQLRQEACAQPRRKVCELQISWKVTVPYVVVNEFGVC